MTRDASICFAGVTMKRTTRAALCAALAALSVFAFQLHAQSKGALSIEKPWARATVPGAAVGGAFLTVRNEGAEDRLVGATSPIAARTEMHAMTMDKDVMRMREVKGIEVPAKGSVELKPGGYHLMLIDLKQPLKQGEKVPLTLKFEKAGEIRVELAVESIAAAAPGDVKHGAMKH